MVTAEEVMVKFKRSQSKQNVIAEVKVTANEVTVKVKRSSHS